MNSILLKQGVDEDEVVVVGIRGYYGDEYGRPDVNDRGFYDDAIVISAPDGIFPYNGNTDPSVYRTGIASLKTGKYRYRAGIHNISKPPSRRYAAFVQAGPVTVARDNSITESGYFGINIHRGSWNSTSSLGCQTVPPGQYELFRSKLNGLLTLHEQDAFWYVLVND